MGPFLQSKGEYILMKTITGETIFPKATTPGVLKTGIKSIGVAPAKTATRPKKTTVSKTATATAKRIKLLEKRDQRVLKALDKGLSYRQIQAKFGIPKSTAFDISVRYGVYSKNA